MNDAARFDVRGYVECGSTTTPFDMHVRNQTSRYHMVIAIFKKMAETDRMPRDAALSIAAKYEQKILDNTEYIKQYGVDMPEIDNWQWHKR